MAIKKHYTAALPVQLTPEWRARVSAVADHPRVEVSMAQVIRDCIEVALPGFELQLGLVEPEEAEEPTTPPGVLNAEELGRLQGKEDRSRGCFGALSAE